MKEKTDKEIEACINRLLASKKPVMLVARFKTVNELEEKHIKHFKNAEYLWQVQELKEEPGLHLGVLLDEELNYVHIVLASRAVLNYVFDRKNQ
jgi:hypothetical protein